MTELEICGIIFSTLFYLLSLIAIILGILHCYLSHFQPRFISKENNKKTYSFGFISEGLGLIAICLFCLIVESLFVILCF